MKSSLALALAGLLFLASGTAAPAQSRLVFDVTTIEVVTDKKRHKWRVQQAISGPQMAQGLMFRKKLDPWKGMLFDFGGPVLARIWMKNTEIPLDILFVKADGTIESIGFGEPFSLRIVRSEGPGPGRSGNPARYGAEIGHRAGRQDPARDFRHAFEEAAELQAEAAAPEKRLTGII